jgi:hypothetical protein
MFKLEVDVQAYALVYGKKNLRKILRQMGALVARKAKTLIRSSRTSTPGQPPMSRTGALAASIKIKPSKNGESVSVRDTMFYALFLKAGAKGGGGNKKAGRTKRGQTTTPRLLEPRPFLSAALDASRTAIQTKIQQSVRDDITMGKR